MTEILMVALIVIVVVFFLGLCIFVHELGHLLVALRCGLHVEKFSIGFGRKIWGFTRNGVVYVVSMLPFGGYVALPQLDPTDEPTDSAGNPLPQARPMARILTAVAGPLSNIVFGFLLATLVWAVGVQRPAPVESYEVHSVQQNSPEYRAGLRPSDEIIAVNGKSVEGGWNELGQEIALTRGEVVLTVQRDGERKTISYEPAANPEVEGLGFPLFEVRMPVVVQQVAEGMPAEAAGVKVNDRIRAVNGEPVAHSMDFVERIWESDGTAISLTLERAGEIVKIDQIVPAEHAMDGETRHIIGVVPGQPEVTVHLSPWSQFTNVITLTKSTLASLFSSKSLVQPKHLSGPVGILQMQYMMIRYRGWPQGLSFVVFVSFSLALLNLLPIPVLDGGHILFAAIEGISRRRIPTRFAYAVQMVFAVLLIGFMLYVTYFDVRRGARTLFPGDDEKEQAQEEAGQEQQADDTAEPQTAP